MQPEKVIRRWWKFFWKRIKKILNIKQVMKVKYVYKFIKIWLLKGLCLIRVMLNFDFLDPGR